VPVSIAVLANDVANPPEALAPGATITLLPPGLTPPGFGALSLGADSAFVFTPGAATGTGTFRYTVTPVGGYTSNPGTVTITVTSGTGGPVPIASNDPSAGAINVVRGQSVVIDVLANDTGNGGTLLPSTVTITTPPAAGTAAVNSTTGAITYTAAPNQPVGPLSFQYTVANTNGNVSPPATVNLGIVAPESISITRARCQSGSRWDVRGTASTNSSSVTVYLTAAVPSLPQPTDILGTAPVDATGAFQLQVSGPACRTPISVRSSLGTVQNNVAVTLR
jgi:hypothetical protein